MPYVRQQPVSRHGTHYRYNKHLRDREEPCNPCTEANTEYHAARRQARETQARARELAAEIKALTEPRSEDTPQRATSPTAKARHERDGARFYLPGIDRDDRVRLIKTIATRGVALSGADGWSLCDALGLDPREAKTENEGTDG